MKQKIKYGLYHIKEKTLLSFSETSNGDDAEFCGETRVNLSTFKGDAVWLVDTPLNAEFVRYISTAWYNSGLDTPEHKFKADDLKVVKVVMTIEDIPEIKLPTLREMLTHKSKKDPGYNHYLESKDPVMDKIGGYVMTDLYGFDRQTEGEKK